MVNNIPYSLFNYKTLNFTKNIICHKIPHRNVGKFREKFISAYGDSNITSWFPGHMYKGMLQLQAKLAVVDCIIEVHDARIPFSGRNPKFYSMLSAIKPHILVLNKCDLADLSYKEQIEKRLQKQNVHQVIFTNCKAQRQGIQKIIPTAVEMIKNSELYNRGNRSSFLLMIIGIPNVGKSSLINRLRNYNLKKKNATLVGAVPGITKTVLEKVMVSESPAVYLLDTPGIIEPTIENIEVGLKLALCRTLKDHLVGIHAIADYLLYFLNKQKNFQYVEYLNLKEPTDNIRLVILHIAKELNDFIKTSNVDGSHTLFPNVDTCAAYFVNAFRKGKFGRIFLDMEYLS